MDSPSNLCIRSSLQFLPSSWPSLRLVRRSGRSRASRTTARACWSTGEHCVCIVSRVSEGRGPAFAAQLLKGHSDDRKGMLEHRWDDRVSRAGCLSRVYGSTVGCRGEGVEGAGVYLPHLQSLFALPNMRCRQKLQARVKELEKAKKAYIDVR